MKIGLYFKMVEDSERSWRGNCDWSRTIIKRNRTWKRLADSSRAGLASRPNRPSVLSISMARSVTGEPSSPYSELFQGPRRGGFALLRDLHDLWLLGTEAEICWTLLAQAAQALRDQDFVETCEHNKYQTHRQLSWLETRSKQAAPQSLIAA